MNICWIGRKLHALREKNKLTQEKLGKDVEKILDISLYNKENDTY